MTRSVAVGMDSSEGSPQRIVVRMPNWLGDVVMSTPGLRALRRAYPSAEIVALVPEALAPVLEGSSAVDAIWPLASGRGAAMRLAARRLAREPFDLGVVIPESISSALLMRRGRVRHVVGYGRDPLRRFLLHEQVPAPADWGRRRWVSKEHFVLALMAAVGAPSSDVRLRLEVTESEEARLARVMEQQGTSLESLAGRPPILIAPGASYGGAKCWPTESFAALADELAGRDGPIFLIGTAAERERLETVERAMRSPLNPLRPKMTRVLAGVLDLGALKALMRRAALLVANDAGARHLASAFDVPSVIFFGPTSLAKTSENLESVEALETEHECRPCYRRECPIDHRCLGSIGVAEAVAAAERALARGECRKGPRTVDLTAVGR